ncbi:J domain-containing protein [Streptomyces sp. HB2AG]|uniref:J domain-containing protein n=1 Tax=Streptomyces sp. HB2AG TaxID=2983400 RepID=UPI0022AA540C|nr:J domain-containing protein [Streptomyces sp. HB2AG]MCZ2524704.1 J domain-containing protein [Streptomyces sp. HB2AG]
MTTREDQQAVERLEKAVSAAEHALIEFEIAVETFRVEVENFSRLHHQRLGPVYARLDELDAQIAEAVAARSGTEEDARAAREARERAMPMPDVDELFGRPAPESPDGGAPSAPEPPRRVRPSREAQRLYRELARRAHPDLAQDAAEQERRSAFIARVNEAYGHGDEQRLRELAQEWEAGPHTAPTAAGEDGAAAGEGPGTGPEDRVEVLYARLEWLAARQESLAAFRAELEESAVGRMLRLAPDEPDGLIAEIAEQLLAQVAGKEARLTGLLAEPGH